MKRLSRIGHGAWRVAFKKCVLVALCAMLFLFCAVVPCAVAATKYIDCALGTDDGSHGTGPGASAWKTHQYALTGWRTVRGDTLVVSDGGGSCVDTTGSWSPSVNPGSGGPIYVQAATGERVTYDIVAGTSNLLHYALDGLYWRNYDFVNTGNQAASWTWFGAGGAMTYEDCTWDHGTNNGSSTDAIRTSGNYNVSVTLIRPKAVNVGKLVNATSGTGTDTISITAGEFDNLYSVVASTGKIVNLTYTNNTSVKMRGETLSIWLAGSTALVRNNIMTTNGSSTNRSAIVVTPAAGTTFLSTPASWDVTHNIFWSSDGPASWDFGDFNAIISNSQDTMYYDPSNYFMDPGFVDFAGGDYRLASTSKATGRGLQSALPSGGDVTGAVWTGKDVGAYANPSSMPFNLSITPNKVAFVGDSILNGSSATAGNECYTQFGAFSSSSALTVLGGSGRSVAGIYALGLQFMVDYVALTDAPGTMFIAVGINELYNSRDTMQTANTIMRILDRVAAWGIRPIWLGIPSLNGNPPTNTTVKAVNALVDTYCATRGYLYGSILERMESFNGNWQTDYYADLTANLHPNNAGHLLIASLAENLYADRPNYWVSDSNYGTANPSATAPATWQHPITVAGMNAAATIPTGEKGRRVRLVGPSSATFTTPVAGASGKTLTLEPRGYTGSWVINQQYWQVSRGSSKLLNFLDYGKME